MIADTDKLIVNGTGYGRNVSYNRNNHLKFYQTTILNHIFANIS